MDLPASVANKGLTAWLSLLDATVTKNTGGPPTNQEPAFSAHSASLRFDLLSLSTYNLKLTTENSSSRSLLHCFPPWHANASANTSSPIYTGAKKSRAPFSFRPIPPSLSRRTINIAVSKSAPVTARCHSTSSPPALPSTPSKSIRRSSPACATSQNNSPTSPSSRATFSKRTSPPSPPAAASASTAIFPTTLPRPSSITCSPSRTSSTKFTSSFRPKL